MIRRLSSQLRLWLMAKLGAVEPHKPRNGLWLELDGPESNFIVDFDDVEMHVTGNGVSRGVRLCVGPYVLLNVKFDNEATVTAGDVIKFKSSVLADAALRLRLADQRLAEIHKLSTIGSK